MEDSNSWKGRSHLIPTSRFYIIRRLKSHLSTTALLKLVDGLFMSKVRYGLQLYGKARSSDVSPKCESFKALQKIQNDLMRFLAGCQVKDKVSIRSLLEKFNMLSVNQLNAQIKLLEIWKAINVQDYPLVIQQQMIGDGMATTKAAARGRPCEIGRSQLTQSTCISDAITLWNIAPGAITGSKTLFQAKREIKKYVKTLPI